MTCSLCQASLQSTCCDLRAAAAAQSRTLEINSKNAEYQGSGTEVLGMIQRQCLGMHVKSPEAESYVMSLGAQEIVQFGNLMSAK